MPKKKESRVPKMERGVSTLLDWETARIFLQVSSHKSFRAAAADLGQPINTLRRKLEQLERQLGSVLLTRYIDGVKPTEEGRRVAEALARMEREASNLISPAKQSKKSAQENAKASKPAPEKPPGLRRSTRSINWEHAHVFLEVARHKSFRRASTVLNQASNALRRKSADFERRLERPLLARHADGLTLTEAGQHAFDVVSRMEVEVFAAVRASEKAEPGARRSVKIAITEGLASFWIAPKIAAFTEKNPGTMIDLRTGTAPADILRLEADVAVQLIRPTQKDVRAVKIARLHVMPYVAKSYADRHGIPTSRPELAKHLYVVQASDHLLSMEEHLEQLRGKIDRISVRSNSSAANYFAIAGGAGIGMLPTIVSALRMPVVPIDLAFRAYHDIWLVYHADAGRIARVRKVIDWLIEAFSPQRYPWFADEFIHPDELEDSKARDSAGVNMPLLL